MFSSIQKIKVTGFVDLHGTITVEFGKSEEDHFSGRTFTQIFVGVCPTKRNKAGKRRRKSGGAGLAWIGQIRLTALFPLRHAGGSGVIPPSRVLGQSG
jgi:hypothetical protein